jgi:hypothetical protein
MLVEALVRLTDGFRWGDMHARAANGTVPAYLLSTSEAAWMDTTMFARWVEGSLPDVLTVIDVLTYHRCDRVAARLQRILDVLDRPEG